MRCAAAYVKQLRLNLVSCAQHKTMSSKTKFSQQKIGNYLKQSKKFTVITSKEASTPKPSEQPSCAVDHENDSKDEIIQEMKKEIEELRLKLSEKEKSVENHENTIDLMKKENDVLKINLKQAKFLLKETSELNLQKDLKIAKLEKDGLNVQGEKLYDDFANKFTEAELKDIRSVRSGEKNDSQFVLLMMKCLYKDGEKEKLNNRSVTGKKYKGEQKLEITMEKKKTMLEMLGLRLKYELPGVSATAECKRRLDRFNQMIRSAIHNILSSSANLRKRSNADIDRGELQTPKRARHENSGKV